MKDTSWKPINPCLDCKLSIEDRDYYQQTYGLYNECMCDLQHHYLIECNTLLSLFLWFRKWEKCDDGNERQREVTLSLINEMTKEMQSC